MAGRLEVRSTPGRGSTFAVILPRTSMTPAVAQPILAAIATDTLRGKRVLVVDDDMSIVDATTRVLESWGCDVQTASSGETAVASALQTAPDLLLTDYRLSEIGNGADVIEAVRRCLQRPVPAVIVTGDITPEQLARASAGGHPVLHKPVSPARLRAALSSAMTSAAAAV
jgi:CheY-like chemotaxis protein